MKSFTLARRNAGFRVFQRGQGMTEYIIIVALIAIAAIAAFTFFGSTIRYQVGGIAHELSGKSASSDISNADKKARSVDTEAGTSKEYGQVYECECGSELRALCVGNCACVVSVLIASCDARVCKRLSSDSSPTFQRVRAGVCG